MIDLIGNVLFVFVYNIFERYNLEVNYIQLGMCLFGYKFFYQCLRFNREDIFYFSLLEIKG